MSDPSPSAVRERVLRHLDEHGTIDAVQFALANGFSFAEVFAILEGLLRDGEVEPE